MGGSKCDCRCFTDVATLLGRLPLGALLLYAGWMKVAKMGVGTFVETAYAPLAPKWLPSFMAMPYGYAIPWIELIGGALLILGLFGRTAAGVLAFLMITIVIAVGVGDPNPNPEMRGPFNDTLIYVGLAILLTATGPGRISLDGVIGMLRRKSCGPTPPAA